jgi:hypothetical protein
MRSVANSTNMGDTADLTLDRVTYREGQRLTARDLKDDRDRKRRLRRLHLRNLHETWGIALGFEVQAAGPSAVAVGPGYALDDDGRELVLSANVAIPVPSVTGPRTFVLAATFLEDCAFPSSAAGAGACLNAPLHPRRERPGFRWLAPNELEPGPMVPLCHVVVQNKAIQGGVQTRVRRYARRLVRPYIATGATDPDPGPWSDVWRDASLVLMERVVSTVEAGFTGTPQYFARLVQITPSPNHSQLEVETALAQAHQHIVQTAADSFVFRAWTPHVFRDDLNVVCAVSWMGVEPLGGCPPVLDLKLLVTLAGRFFSVK